MNREHCQFLRILQVNDRLPCGSHSFLQKITCWCDVNARISILLQKTNSICEWRACNVKLILNAYLIQNFSWKGILLTIWSKKSLKPRVVMMRKQAISLLLWRRRFWHLLHCDVALRRRRNVPLHSRFPLILKPPEAFTKNCWSHWFLWKLLHRYLRYLKNEKTFN